MPWSDWYTGAMAPPDRLPDGTLVPARPQTPLTVEQMYEGIYGPSSSGLKTRSFNTGDYPINPATGMPYALTASGTMMGSSGSGFAFDPARARMETLGPLALPQVREVVEPGYARGGVGFESGNAYGPQHRLVPETPALSAAARVAGASGRGAAFPFSLSIPSEASPDVVTLRFEPGSAESAQNMANSAGKTVVTPSGKVYRPMLEFGPPGTRTKEASDEPRRGFSLLDMLSGKGLGNGLIGMMFGGSSGTPLANAFRAAPQAPRNAAGRPIPVGGVLANNSAVYASGGRDYGSDPGQATAGLRPGERRYDPDTNSWGLKV